MADFTETPYAEDFHMELGDLVDEYLDRGMTTATLRMVVKLIMDEVALGEEDE